MVFPQDSHGESEDRYPILYCCACVRVMMMPSGGIAFLWVNEGRGEDHERGSEASQHDGGTIGVRSISTIAYSLSIGKRPPLGGPLKGIRNSRALERVFLFPAAIPTWRTFPILFCLIRLRE